MTIEELGRRAVACKHWRWSDGSKRVHPEHRWAWRLVGWRWFPCDERSNAVHDDVFKESLPDLSDHATLGCLLALVREAWGNARITLQWDHRFEHWSCGHAPDALSWVNYGAGDTEAEALVAALEAAP